jgi:hypothetical protein
VILGGTRRILLIGLGTVAGAVLPARLQAQIPVTRDTVPPARRDTLAGRRDTLTARRDTLRLPLPPRADSMAKNDSIAKGGGIVPLPAAPKPDTIKPPLAHAEAPPILEIGPARVYDRAALFATGVLRLSDLLGRIPGVTELTTGWLSAPAVVASQGDLHRIRIFLDGLELDPLDRRSQGVAPVNDLPLHALEELRIERGVEEIRVYARSWRVDRTDPYTRADIGTGDQNINLYRAFFGRRYDHGEVLQLSAEQNNTQPDSRLPSSSELHVMARVGLTRGPWSADLFAERSDRDRAPWVGYGNAADTRDTVAGIENRRTTGYLRLGNGDPDAGRWLQLLVAAEGYHAAPRFRSSSTSTTTTTAPIPDSTSYENQYLLTGGITRGNARVSFAERIRTASQRTSHVLSGRAGYEVGWLGASLFGEGQSALDPSRLEATVRVVPLDRVALLASASRTGGGKFARIFGDFEPTLFLTADGKLQRPFPDELGGYDSTRVARYELAPRTNLRAEAGIRVRDVWLSGGLLRRGATTLLPPADFDTAYARPGAIRAEGEAIGRTVAIRGRLYKAVNVDAWALAWGDSAGLYRPRYQARSELYIQTSLLDRFPRGNFGLLASLAHEYRSNTKFAAYGDSVRTALGFRSLTFKLEIRIQTAVVSYQFRNLLQQRYADVPGFYFPRQTQFYGVRWEFWN